VPWRLQTMPPRDTYGEQLFQSLRRTTMSASALRQKLHCPKGSAKVRRQHKIPEIEQVISAGAATQNMILAFHVGGFASMWRTGKPAYDPEVKTAFGLEPHDHIVGMIYVGTPLGLTPGKPAPTRTASSRHGTARIRNSNEPTADFSSLCSASASHYLGIRRVLGRKIRDSVKTPIAMARITMSTTTATAGIIGVIS
jgi:hypothetical protein